MAAPRFESIREREIKRAPNASCPPIYEGQKYSIHEGSLHGWKALTDGNHVPFEVANFTARIVLDQIRDDGVETLRIFKLEAKLGEQTMTVDVPAKDFRSMNWVAEKLGGRAIIYPGQAEHVRAGIQMLSENIPELHSYGCTGWRKIEGRNYYLHAGGGIGADGNRTDICVDLQDKLPLYRLPDPPSSKQLVAAVRASIEMLDVTVDRLTFPVYAGIWRAVLGTTTFSLFIAGGSGAGKSALAALAQQHFGLEMDADHLPASWLDTGSAARELAFYAKDALLVCDDFVPTGSVASQQKLHGEADKLLRAQGNGAGRRRLSSDGRLLATRPPRGLILSTGEDMPRGRSLNARLIILNFPLTAMKWDNLTACQKLAKKGVFARVLSSFAKWLAPQLESVQENMREEKLTRRASSESGCVHMRTPENLSSLRYGLSTYLRFAQEIGAITSVEARALMDRAEKAFKEIELGEIQKHAHNDTARMFVRYVWSSVTMGKAHLADPKTGMAPGGEKAFALGWRVPAGATGLQSQGPKIGWATGDEIYLLPQAAYAVAFQLARDQGEVLPGSLEIVKRELKERQLLLRSDDKRRTLTIRKTMEGEQQDVLAIHRRVLSGASQNDADNADNADNATDEDLDPPFEPPSM